MRPVTNSFKWSFHLERYLRSTCSLLDQFFCIEINEFQKHCFCWFPVDSIWFSIFWSFSNKFPQSGILYDPYNMITCDNIAMWFVAKLGNTHLKNLSRSLELLKVHGSQHCLGSSFHSRTKSKLKKVDD